VAFDVDNLAEQRSAENEVRPEGSIFQMQDGRYRTAVTAGWKLNGAAGRQIYGLPRGG